MNRICSWIGCRKIWLSPAIHFKLKMYSVLHPVFILAQIMLSEIQIFKGSCVSFRKLCDSYALQQHRVKSGIRDFTITVSYMQCFKSGH